jgi:hypothetical protein
MAAHPDKNQGVVGALPASQRVNEVSSAADDEPEQGIEDVCPECRGRLLP